MEEINEEEWRKEEKEGEIEEETKSNKVNKRIKNFKLFFKIISYLQIPTQFFPVIAIIAAPLYCNIDYTTTNKQTNTN